MLEKTFENKVKEALKYYECYFVKYYGCAFSEAGTPDLLCCIGGRFVGIEVKSEKGKPSELQLLKLKRIRDAGGIGIVLSPRKWEDFEEMISLLAIGNFTAAKTYQNRINDEYMSHGETTK